VAVIRHCAACTELLPDNARFCPGCGQAVSGDESAAALDESIGHALATELRHLTVLFCDLVGSTDLSSTIDAEEYSDLIQAYQQQAVTIVRALGGDVEGYSGDGILFRFGWPQAHLDDAAQALTAALAIVDAVGATEETRGLAIRVGVHSGPAVVGELGGADRRATMAVGETLNTSARLQALAEPGTVVTSAATAALVEGRFDLTPLGAVRLRGIPEPVEAFQVHGGSFGWDRRPGEAGRLSPLVGRDGEIAALHAVWAQVCDGRGCGVLLTGEPGVGKSRLAMHVHELVQADNPLWLAGSCSPYTRMSVLRPVIDLVEGELALHTDLDPAWQLAQLRTELAQAEVEVPDGDVLIASLLGIPGMSVDSVDSLSSELRRERTIDALVAWVLALSRMRPLVLCIEDLHWCDATTLDAVERLLRQVADAPVLVLLTARPEFEPPWEPPGAVATIGLEPLEDAHVRELATALGDGLTLPGPVVDRIVASAGGNPLYVEEVGRTVLESGLLVRDGDHWELASPLMDLEIPGTLQGSLLARLDGLGPAKAVAQLAAVLGRSFPFDLLVTVSGMDPSLLARFLERVVDSGLVLRDPAHEGGYSFKHALIQEAAYESLLRKNRRTIHERVARVLDARIASGASTASEVVARHYEAADLPFEAATRYQLAARMAADRSGHREAVGFLRRGIDQARQLGDTVQSQELEVEMQLSLGSALATRSYADPEMAAAYERARELCELLGDDERVGQTLGGLSVYYVNRGEIALGAELAERVLAIAEARGDDLLAVLGGVQLSLARSWQGRPVESLELANRALAAYHPGRHHVLGRRFGTDQGVAAHVFAGWSQLLLGHLDRGLAHLVDAVDLADTIGQPFNRVYALVFLATGHCERGESAETLRFAERARWLAEEQGFDLWAGVGGVWEATERVVTGDHGALDDVLQAGFAAGGTGSLGGSTNVLGRVAEAARAAGDREMTAGLLETALSLSAETGQPWWDAALHRQRAELLFDGAATGGERDLADPTHPWSQAADAWLRSLELAEEMGLPVHGARAAAGYAGLLQRVGRVDEGRRLLAGWYGRCPEGRDTPVLTAVRSQLDALGGPLP
jgi:class 3 adenylate cyclase/tetratricopeptide (TPR) repeat protein